MCVPLSHTDRERERERERETERKRRGAYPFEPRRHLVLAVAADVGLNDDDGNER